MQILTVTMRVIQQLVKDKRTLVFLLLAPVLVLTLLYFIMSSGSDEANIGVIDIEDALHDALVEESHVIDYDTKQQALNAMKEQDIDAYLYTEDNKPHIEIEGADMTKRSLVIQSIQNALQSYQKERGEEIKEAFETVQNELKPLLENIQQQTDESLDIDVPNTDLSMEKPEIHYLYNDADSDLFDQVAPAIMGFFIFFFVFIIAGISFLRERTTGTLERTLATPLKRSSIVFGYFLGFFLFVAIQTIIVQTTIVDILDVQRVGNYGLLLFLNLVIATVALSLGLLLSIFARTEFQLLQFIPIAIVPQFFFSGIFDLSNAPAWVKIISHLMPLTYATEALQNIMIRGYTFIEVSKDFAVLAGFAILFILLNMAVLKKQRPA